jgi:hypothetical protein
MDAKNKRWVANVKTASTHPRAGLFTKSPSNDRARAGFQEGLAEGAAIGHEDSDILHQSGRPRAQFLTASQIGQPRLGGM